MTDDNVVKEGANDGNPSNQGTQKPEEQPKPSNGGSGNPNPNEELQALKDKYETVKRQYGASTEEALRLKAEVDELKEMVKELKDSNTAVPENDEEFQSRIAKVGMAQAIRELIEGSLKPITETTKQIIDEKVDNLLNAFKSKHPGLKDGVLAKFDKEFARLKSVYKDPAEAMEAAYAVIGGSRADEEAQQPEKDKAKAKEADEQSKTDKEQFSSNASGGKDDRRTTPVDQDATVTAEIQKLVAQAQQLEADGREAIHLWTQIDEMKQKLARKQAAKSV